METILLSNPIYQHSGETEKDKSLAQQAAVNEDQEQRRRQLDANGEKRRAVLAHEVAHMVDELGGSVRLKHAPIEEPTQPILSQAQQKATTVVTSAFEAGKGLLHTATDAVAHAVDTATHVAKDAVITASHMAKDAVDTVSHAAKDATDTVTHVAKDAADTVTHAAKDAAATVSHTAQEVAHSASDLAGVVSQKTRHLAEEAVNKTREIADNISHFTTLVGVLAEEENERARRMISGDEARAAANAFRISELIRELGPAFYKQTPNLNYATKVLEEAERRWRLNSGSSSQAESNAHNIGKLVSNNMQSFMPRYQWVRLHISGIEEKERTRRLNDTNEAYAIQNALRLSFMIRELGIAFYKQEGAFSKAHASYATTLLEENERRNRIRTDKLRHAEDSAHLLMDVVATNIEKFSYSTRNASRVANDIVHHASSYLERAVKPSRISGTFHEFANMLANATAKVANSFSSMSKDLAKNTAQRVRAVASDLSNYTNIMYLTALEERERARRLDDPDECDAINNAWEQSALIRDLSALYRPSSMARFPLRMLEDQERRWRLSNVSPSSSRKVAAIVNANLAKFQSASQRGAEFWHAKDTTIHSRLNPNAPAFVPLQALPAKVEPALTQQRTNLPYGAQH